MIYLVLLIYLFICMLYFGQKIKWLKRHFLFYESKSFRRILSFFCFVLALSVILAGTLPYGQIQLILKKFSNYWIAFFLDLILCLLIIDFIAFILCGVDKKHPIKIIRNGKFYSYAGVIVIVGTALLTYYGYYHARQITTNCYEVKIEKSAGNLDHINMILLSDIHLGYNTKICDIQRIVDTVNGLEPDIIVITGDIFNSSFDEIPDTENLNQVIRQMKSKYGTYAVFGNHDVDEELVGGFPLPSGKEPLRDPRMNQFLYDAGINILTDDVVEAANHSIYLAGRLDYENPGNGNKKRKPLIQLMEDVDLSKPVILLDHEPIELQNASELGIDLMLSGHTHDGQIIPFVYFQKLRWKNAYGIRKFGNMYSIVTSGVGTFTPNMRTGSDSEVVQVMIYFQS